MLRDYVTPEIAEDRLIQNQTKKIGIDVRKISFGITLLTLYGMVNKSLRKYRCIQEFLN